MAIFKKTIRFWWRPSEFCDPWWSHQLNWELADVMNCDQQPLCGICIPWARCKNLVHIYHNFKWKQQKSMVGHLYISVCCHRLACEQHRPFLTNIVTGNGNWCFYINKKKRKEWLSPNKRATPHTKVSAHPQKMMIFIWWNKEGVIYYKLLPRIVTLTADIYCQQLRCLAAAIEEKWLRRLHQVLLWHNNAQLYSANMTKAAIQELGWEVIPHPHILSILHHQTSTFSILYPAIFRGNSFDNEDALQTWLGDFLNSKPADFFRHGIKKLP